MISKRVPIGQYCCERVETISKDYDGLIDYIDISSVGNVEKKIHTYQTIEAKEAPSRAKQLVQKGDILVSTVRPNLNAVAIVESLTENLMVCSTGYCVLRSNGTIDNRFLFYFCQSNYFVDDMTSQATGASYPAVNSGIVKKSLIPIYTLEQQKHISSQLDKVSRLIDFRKHQLLELDELVKSRFIELFGDPVLNPFGFEECLVNKCCKMTQGTQIPMSEQVNEYQNGYYRYLYIRDLKYGDDNWIYVQDKFDDKKLTTKDLVVVNTGNTAGEIYYGKDGILSNNLFKVSFDTNILNTTYMFSYFSSEQFQGMLWSEMKEGTQPHLGHKIFGSKKLIVPPIDLQNQFANFVEQTDKLKLEVKESLEKLETLKKSLMQEYFG